MRKKVQIAKHYTYGKTLYTLHATVIVFTCLSSGLTWVKCLYIYAHAHT